MTRTRLAVSAGRLKRGVSEPRRPTCGHFVARRLLVTSCSRLAHMPQGYLGSAPTCAPRASLALGETRLTGKAEHFRGDALAPPSDGAVPMRQTPPH